MGNLSCVSCQMRKSTNNIKKQKPSAVSTEKPCAEPETVKNAVVSHLDDAKGSAMSTMPPPSLPVSAHDVNNVTAKPTLPVVVPNSEDDDDKRKQSLLDWWWETICRPRYECLSKENLSNYNIDIKQPDVEVFAAAAVELNLYLASQVICPAIERHLAELLLDAKVDNAAV